VDGGNCTIVVKVIDILANDTTVTGCGRACPGIHVSSAASTSLPPLRKDHNAFFDRNFREGRP